MSSVPAPAEPDAGPAEGPPALPSDAGADAAVPQWSGPFFTVTTGSTGIYAQPILDRALKIGYARNGGRIPVLAETVTGEGCRGTWYVGVEGGYICSTEGTIDAADPRARLSATPPDLTAILPYPYARNARNGTPLYSSVPSLDQMAAYEPRVERGSDEADDSSERPWWQRDKVQLSQVKLAELATDSDGLLAKRLVQGFYIAIDREFEWLSRSWYKTTKGMVAPKDRFVAVEGYGFHGVELADDVALPVAWVYGSRETRPRFRVDGNVAKQTGTLARHEAIHLTGQKVEIGGQEYVQTIEQDWLQAAHVRVAVPPEKLPANLAANERWISVDLRTQTQPGRERALDFRGSADANPGGAGWRASCLRNAGLQRQGDQ